jgi:hypothetical protein
VAKVIHKYWIGNINKDFYVTVPKGIVPLRVGLQSDQPYMWGIVDKANELVEQKFHCLMTGFDEVTPDIGEYIGTIDNHGIVAHFFQDLNTDE